MGDERRPFLTGEFQQPLEPVLERADVEPIDWVGLAQPRDVGDDEASGLSEPRDDGRPVDAAALDAAVQQDERPPLPAVEDRCGDASHVQTPLLNLDPLKEPCPRSARPRLPDGMPG